MIIATAQNLITRSIRDNSTEIQNLLQDAHRRGADLVHFPEGALSGYAKHQLTSDWSRFPWDDHEAELAAIASSCAKLSIWAVIGGVHRPEANRRPYNSLYVINDQGDIASRYDKRFCSHTEISDWYRAGSEALMVDVKGTKIGFLLCIEIQFPELFIAYERADVDCVLLSSYSDNPMFTIQAQAHAACNNFWVSFSVPTNKSNQHASRLLGPDGSIVDVCSPGHSGLVVNTIDPHDPRWDVPCQKARPWRRLARSRSIYN